MTRQVKELTEADLVQLTQRVRARLGQVYGAGRIQNFLSADRGLVSSFLKQTYIAVREQIEKEDADGKPVPDPS